MRSLFLSVALLAATGTALAQSATSLPIGATMPMERAPMKTTGAKTITLSDSKTPAGLLVMFSCNTCPYVVKSQQRTLEAMKLAKTLGVGFVVVNSNEAQRDGADSYNAMTAYAKKQGYTYPYALDEGSKLADAFGATRTPEVFLFDGKGLLIYKGAMEDNPSDPGSSTKMYLASAMKIMKSGGKVEPAETKSIGCSIKRVN